MYNKQGACVKKCGRAGVLVMHAFRQPESTQRDMLFRLPQALVQPETEHGVSPPYPLFPLP
ncbi:hypothetical protein [Kingella sp. (in: b-proteobacteria)]|uniref:hypothetical protein n=1 Tax=Kingella sp. (in: b-proteobacteria) TaxID=2020713 RepID=UPI0026DBC238|nr:hypothetical protein [Kingella sp. (in: b-proteobacteria)]MDO4656863.1 hypothetical protein [Kingella sp. (in: b-proteobacteria)]